MPLDLYELARQIALGGPRLAAKMSARLIEALLGMFPGEQSYAQFVAVFRAEMAKIGFRAEPDLRLARFDNLKNGDHFTTLDGRRFAKAAPTLARELMDDPLAMLEVDREGEERAIYISPDQVVERMVN